ncbi:FLYWCH-type zinc finger-containing protein 1-like [Ostrinia furnacalis]|uniref:FLYWCH-type zinc finger-containing protein 1-like n=1 Tax=Ostrinia furnacalis TaxID=93504 RepID=UPI00103F7C20|nr:FLYWCH-type zinc finger-containing protein 1-like [Ostrinia furnacalis]
MFWFGDFFFVSAQVISIDFTLHKSKRGALILVCDGFKYRRDYLHGERVSWRCVRRQWGCKATVGTVGNELVKLSGVHSHPPEDADDIMAGPQDSGFPG